MKIYLDRSGSLEVLERYLQKVSLDPAVTGILILAAEKNGFEARTLDPVLHRCSKPLIGGVFPGILYGEENMARGSIVAGLTCPLEALVLNDLNESKEEMGKRLSVWEERSLKESTLFVFVDGLSSGVASLKNALFDHLGLDPNYIGGGAGSLCFEQQPCVITNEGLLANAAGLLCAETKCGIGVAHGWKPVSDPMKITESEGNRVISLNGQPAQQMYADAVYAISCVRPSEENFFEVAKSHPFGIVKIGQELVVRDPVALPGDGSIRCVGEMPEGSFVYVLKGERASLIRGAREARLSAEAFYDNRYGVKMEDKSVPSGTKTLLLIDCISRALFLQDDFHEELHIVQNGSPLFGALTLGEMANTGKSYLEFYNKTCVIGILGE